MGKKIGICLTGGGARGSYQIGAIQALKELDILDKISSFSGTSIGSANAAVVASTGLEKAKKIWFEMPENNIPKNTPLKKKTDLLKAERGFYSMKVFEDVMLRSIDYDALRKKEVFVTVAKAGNEHDGFFELIKRSLNHRFKKISQAYYLPLHELSNETIHRAIIASCSIPVVFAPVTIDGKKYCDGGICDNVPIAPLVDAGCDEIIIVYLHKYNASVKSKAYPNVTFHEIKHDKARELGRVLKFSHKQTKALYQYGYDDTMALFRSLQDA